MTINAMCNLWGCKNMTCFISFIYLLASAVFFCFFFVFVICFLVLGCHYQCNQLTEKTRLRTDLLCVQWDVKPYIFTNGNKYIFSKL